MKAVLTSQPSALPLEGTDTSEYHLESAWPTRSMHDIVQGLPGVKVIEDDILVYGKGSRKEEYIQDHDHNLTKLLERARAVNLKLNKKNV